MLPAARTQHHICPFAFIKRNIHVVSDSEMDFWFCPGEEGRVPSKPVPQLDPFPAAVE